MQQINERDSTSKLDLTVILRFTVQLDLRHASQDRHRPACTPKSLRRLMYVFRLTSFLLLDVPSPFSYASTVREALPLTINDPRLRFTSVRSRLSIESEFPRYTTITRTFGSRGRMRRMLACRGVWKI